MRAKGGSRIFFRRGCSRLLLHFNTNKPHRFFFFFCSIPVVLENRRSSGGGGVRTPCTPISTPESSRLGGKIFQVTHCKWFNIVSENNYMKQFFTEVEESNIVSVYMLWFNFIVGLNFIFLCFKLIIIHYHTPKQRKIKFKPTIKLNHNMYIQSDLKSINLHYTNSPRYSINHPLSRTGHQISWIKSK